MSRFRPENPSERSHASSVEGAFRTHLIGRPDSCVALFELRVTSLFLFFSRARFTLDCIPRATVALPRPHNVAGPLPRAPPLQQRPLSDACRPLAERHPTAGQVCDLGCL